MLPAMGVNVRQSTPKSRVPAPRMWSAPLHFPSIYGKHAGRRIAGGHRSEQVCMTKSVGARTQVCASPRRVCTDPVDTHDSEVDMFMHVQRLINEIIPDEPDPAAANALQEGLGGQFGEMRTMMQYLFQAFNFRGATGKPYRDLLYGVGTEEIAHVELIATTISRLLDGSPQYNGKATKPVDEPGKGGATPLSIALDHSNIHHYLVGAQGALPVDAAGNPWAGSYVYNSGNLVLDLLYNLMLESTGRLQKCRIYEMTDNKTARATISYLIVRDQAHENAYAKALESLGINWGATLPIPKTNAERSPEVKKLLDQGLHLKQYTFSADNLCPRPARSTAARRRRRRTAA